MVKSRKNVRKSSLAQFFGDISRGQAELMLMGATMEKTDGSNNGEDEGEASCVQPARLNAQEKEEK
ncbi:hypothetical protein Bca101_059992 [Brassica carinata]